MVVVIPAYNESGVVGSVAASVPATLAGQAVATLVVDDGSIDGTAAEAAAAGVHVCRLERNCGQGTALRLGYDVAIEHGARMLATLDADGQWAAADLEPMVALVSSGQADIVSGSRRLAHDPDHRDTDTKRLRRNGVVLFAALIRILTGARVTDPANGLRVMSAEVANGVQLDQPQFQSTELLISALSRGYRYAEVPVAHFRREVGESKKGTSTRYALDFTGALLRTYLREHGWRGRIRRG